jgi:enoyl-CoA hydratase
MTAGDDLLEAVAGPVLWLTINRPEKHNALNAGVLDCLHAAVVRAGLDPGIRVVLVTGAGDRAFCAGADLDELRGIDAVRANKVLQRGGQVMRAIDTSPVPVIAVVNGVALGGGFELALASSFIVASDQASFGLPETGLGLLPGFGGTQRLPRAVGLHAARRLSITGGRLSAGDAYRIGLLLDPPCPTDELIDRASTVAHQIASRGPEATASALLATGTATDASLDTGLELERALAAVCIASEEGSEGIAAFLERRRPAFEARGSS